MAIVPSSSVSPPSVNGLKTPRVQRALLELRRQLDEAATLAGQLRRAPAPTVVAIAPTQAPPGGLVRLEVMGTDFQANGPRVSLQRAATSGSGRTSPIITILEGEVFFVSDRLLSVTFDLTDQVNQSGTIWSLRVVNPDGGDDLATNIFTIKYNDNGVAANVPSEGGLVQGIERPMITAAQAAPSGNGQLALTVNGVELPAVPSVRLIHDGRATIVAHDVQTNAERTQIRAAFEMSPHLAQESPWSVAVSGADGTNLFMLDCLDVPVISG